MHPDIKEVLYDEEQIKQRVAEIGAALTSEYADRVVQRNPSNRPRRRGSEEETCITPPPRS